MKIKEVMKLVRESGSLWIGQNGPDKYIGNGVALYQTSGEYDIETLFMLTDTTDKQKEKLRVMPIDSCSDFLADIDGSECELTRMSFSINYGGDTFSVFESERGAVFINKKYLKPLTDEQEPEFKLRSIGDTEMVIVHYGLVAAAAIMPYRLIDIGFDVHAEKLASLCRLARENRLFCERE